MASPLPTQTFDVIDIDAVAKTIRQMESGNNYTIGNNTSTASGAYQYLDSTWIAQARAAGVDVSAYPRAKDAPPAIQDAVAKRWISQILSANGNNVAAVPATWYVGSWQHAQMTADQVPSGNSLTPRQYIEKWLATFNKTAGQSPGNANIIDGVTGVVSNAGDIASATGEGIAGTFSSVGDLIKAISNTIFNVTFWKWLGIGALGIFLVYMAFQMTSTGNEITSSVKSTAGKAAMVAGA